jgi:3-phenylpropionate/trans-cinnamate dioxygenase ferredoxin component
VADYVDIASADELQDGQMKKVEVDGQELLLAKVEGSYYVIDDRCPHMGGDLSKGALQGSVVTCPRHSSQFDVRDGHLIRWTDWSGIKLTVGKLFKSPRSTKGYAVRQEGDTISVDLSSASGEEKEAA